MMQQFGNVDIPKETLISALILDEWMAREWDIKRTTFSVGDFIGWNRQDVLELSPSFQRRPVWTKPQKSYLIDTVVRGLPIPIIFIRERTDIDTLETIREVIDGQQRLRTLIAFADLENLKDADDRDRFSVLEKHNTKIAGFDFNNLHKTSRHHILSYQFSVHVLPSDTSDADVLKIFARMNSTGTKLNEQELRNAEFFGVFKEVVYDTATSQLERWRKWNVLSEQDIARMTDAELTSQIFILIDQDGLYEQTQRVIKKHYQEFDDKFPKSKSIVKAFKSVMDDIDEHFGGKMKTSNFKKRAQFYQLFNLIFNLKKRGVKIDRKMVKRILALGDRIRDRDKLPDDVELALQARSNRLSNQKIVAEFLMKNATI